MSDQIRSRRETVALAVSAALAAGGLAAASTPAAAYQGNMERALSQLFGALASLREATPNKGGHRERAINLIKQAISEVEQGIVWAEEHGGG